MCISNISHCGDASSVCLCVTHQPQQVEEEVCVFPDQIVRLTAQVHKVMEATGGFVSSINDICHVRGEDKGGAVSAKVSNTVRQGNKNTQVTVAMHLHLHLTDNMLVSPLNVPKHLCVSQELSKVDVEHVTTGLQHDVVVVAVTDPQDVRGHTAAST